MSTRVLIIDDEDIFREDLATLLRDAGLDCRTASNSAEGQVLAEAFNPEVVLCDIAMPGKSGIEVLDDLAMQNPECAVVMITAYGTLDSAIEAFRKGASDYITKPVVVEDVLLRIDRIVKYKRLLAEVKFLRREIAADLGSLPMVGKSEGMQRVLDLVGKVAPTRSTVLLTGESGTGKEVVAQALHEMSARTPNDHDETSIMQPFVAINCAGISSELLESELFGHVRGAFTGAVKNRTGYFELAGNGTLFLDEIGEMPLPLQSKLLRVLEQQEFVRVGSTSPIPLKARIVTASNQDLAKMVKENRFRQDLYFRIAVFEISLPALRDRRSDIPLLADHFVRRFNREMKRNCKGLDNAALGKLMTHDWPGNVRELKNAIERAMILLSDDYIGVDDLPPQISGKAEAPKPSEDLRQAMRIYEQEHIRRVIRSCHGNKEEAARRLGVNLSTLYRKAPFAKS